MNTTNNTILYLTPPEDFSPKIEVVASFIQQQNKILLLKRQALKPEGNTWCVPGGKRDKNESLNAAIQRETWEETGLNFKVDDFIHCYVTYARYPYMDFIYHLFRITNPYNTDNTDNTDGKLNIQLNPEEHEAFQWLTVPEANQLSLTPGVKEALTLLF